MNRELYIQNVSQHYSNFLQSLGYNSEVANQMTGTTIENLFLNTNNSVLQSSNEYPVEFTNCGVYMIYNIITQQCYIGSSKNMRDRKYSHFYCLKRQDYKGLHIQNSFNKYGEESFVFIPLLFCSPDERLEKEQYFIDTIKPVFNTLLVVGKDSSYKHRQESIKLMSSNKKGKSFHSEYQLKRLTELGNDEEMKLRRKIGRDNYWEGVRTGKIVRKKKDI